MNNIDDRESTYPWRIRRAIIFATLSACALGVAYLTLAGTDTRLNETLAMGYFALAGGTIGSYVFNATWHDVNLMRRRAVGNSSYRSADMEAGGEEGDQ